MKLRFLTAGESHGKALVAILEGLPSGLEINSEYIQKHMKRRKLGYGRGARQKIEDDLVQILSGVRHGRTLASPVALLVENKDSKNWSDVMQIEEPQGEVRRQVEVPRPGHADYIGAVKYQFDDMRNVLERSSARETTMRVAVGTLARRLLEEVGIQVASRVIELGSVIDKSEATSDLVEMSHVIDSHPSRALGVDADKRMCQLVDETQAKGETLGGVFEVIAKGLPIGLGSYVQWDRRLEAEIGKAFLSLNAIKGVEIGLGFALARSFGSEAHDELEPGLQNKKLKYKSNRSGGIDGGMSTSQPLVIRAGMKPLSTLMKPLDSVKLSTNESAKAHVERSDVTAVASAAVIGESLLCLVLADAVLDKFGGDSIGELKSRVIAWRNQF